MSDPSRVVTLPALTSDPTYLQFFESTSDFVAQNYVWLKTHYNFPTDTFADFETCRTRIASKDIMTVLCLTILWTVARYSATEYLFKVTFIFILHYHLIIVPITVLPIFLSKTHQPIYNIESRLILNSSHII